MNKYILAAGIGSLLEWAEFTFYAYMVLLFAHLFFPNVSSHLALYASLGAFSVSYIARPLGSIIFGHIGDKYGRQRALSYSVLLMGWVTLFIGLLPTYDKIGVAAPCLLLLFRFLQGLAVSGEFNGAAIYLVEKHEANSFLTASWVSTFAAAGMLLGSFSAFVVSLPNMPDWAWRVPFLFGSLACAVGFYIRRNLSETADFLKIAQKKLIVKIPLFDVLKLNKMAILKTILIASFVAVYIYLCNVWWVTFAIHFDFLLPSQAKFFATIGQACVVLFTPVMAILADKYFKERLMIVGFLMSFLVAPLLFWSTINVFIYLVLISQILYAVCNAMVTGPMFLYITKLFPIKTRYTGQAASWNLAAAIFGGTAPLIAQFMVSNWHWYYGPVFYVYIFAFLVLAVLVLFHDN